MQRFLAIDAYQTTLANRKKILDVIVPNLYTKAINIIKKMKVFTVFIKPEWEEDQKDFDDEFKIEIIKEVQKLLIEDGYDIFFNEFDMELNIDWSSPKELPYLPGGKKFEECKANCEGWTNEAIEKDRQETEARLRNEDKL